MFYILYPSNSNSSRGIVCQRTTHATHTTHEYSWVAWVEYE
jgi:hypothetical protein